MNDFVELRQVIASVVRWWWLLILSTALAAAAAYRISQLQPPVYEATTAIIVGQSIQIAAPEKGDILTSEQLARTYADIARRQPVLQSVVEALSLNDTWQSLKERVTVEQVEETQLLEITVEAYSPEVARVIANEVARQLILVSPTALQNQGRDENQRLVRQRLEDLQSRIEAGQQRNEELQLAMASSLSAQQVRDLQDEINILESLMADWENTYTQLLIFTEGERSPNYLAVIEPAQAKPNPIRPRVRLNTLIAATVGLSFALGLILLLEYLDDTLKSPDDIREFLGLISLGSVGRMKGKYYHEKLTAMWAPLAPISEAYRIIRSNIQFTSVDRPVKSIMVTSACLGEGKSITAANLGLVMAQAGFKTILVDTDMRRPVQHEVFKVPRARGLTDLLRSPELQIDNHLKQAGIENLFVVTCGDLPPNPAELLGSNRMEQLLSGLDEIADMVIYDSPPVLAVTDPAVLSNRVDGVVLVVKAGQIRRGVAGQAVTHLRQAGANLLGCVLNQVPRKREGYYYYHYNSDRHGPEGRSVQRIWRWLPFFK